MAEIHDYGAEPYVVDVEELTLSNDLFRQTAWTGSNLQMTVMAIQPGGDVGLEKHDDHDQFLRIEQGSAKVVMGPSKDNLNFEAEARDDFAIFVPAGVWHNIVNESDEVLKLYSIYAPAEHPKGTVHKTQAESEAAEAEAHGA
ncbi:cupin domain-containing protein [Candidatus Saccharibacteria bacterium]|nr:cupin domain-containing protein [Candidatus Saccharibacteria bacterium]